MAGFYTLLSLAIGHLVTPWAYLFTAFVGLNLLQPAFTKSCPAMAVLRAPGVPDWRARRARHVAANTVGERTREQWTRSASASSGAG
jgi:hypothetical protein